MSRPMTDSELLQALIARGLITEETISAISGPSPQRLNLLRIIHTLFCPSEHAALFLQEEMQAEFWKLPEHKRWEEYTKKLLQHFNFKSNEEALEQLSNATSIAQTATPTTITLAYYITSPELLYDIIGAEFDPILSELGDEQNQLPEL